MAQNWLINHIPDIAEDDNLLYTYSTAVKKYWGKIANSPPNVRKISKVYGCN